MADECSDLRKGALQTTYGGGSDAFVAEINPPGSALIYSTYLGGSSFDVAYGIAVDGVGNGYVTGWSNSTDFPTTPGAFQTAATAANNSEIGITPPTGSKTTSSSLSRRGLVQPVVKCRGREYLRIIPGPEYTARSTSKRLRSKDLGTKRSLALCEFAIGIEALQRFVEREPLRLVHECVFGVVALESEPVDPRL